PPRLPLTLTVETRMARVTRAVRNAKLAHSVQPQTKMTNDDFSTCELCALHKNDSSGAFRVLPPLFRAFGAGLKFAGAVSTVKCFEDNSLVKAALDEPGRQRLLV